jgi:hypothetical protein
MSATDCFTQALRSDAGISALTSFADATTSVVVVPAFPPPVAPALVSPLFSLVRIDHRRGRRGGDQHDAEDDAPAEDAGRPKNIMIDVWARLLLLLRNPDEAHGVGDPLQVRSPAST